MTAILMSLIPYLVPVVTALLGWAVTAINKAAAATAAEKKAQLALTKIGAIASSLLQHGWESIGPEVQTALADGTMDAAEREKIEARVKELLADATDEGTLTEIGSALGLPMAGVVAKIASWLISKWTQAHDPSIPTVSPNQFPTPTMVLEGGGAPDPTAG